MLSLPVASLHPKKVVYYSKKTALFKNSKKSRKFCILKNDLNVFLVSATKIRIFELARFVSIIRVNNFWSRLHLRTLLRHFFVFFVSCQMRSVFEIIMSFPFLKPVFLFWWILEFKKRLHLKFTHLSHLRVFVVCFFSVRMVVCASVSVLKCPFDCLCSMCVLDG